MNYKVCLDFNGQPVITVRDNLPLASAMALAEELHRAIETVIDPDYYCVLAEESK